MRCRAAARPLVLIAVLAGTACGSSPAASPGGAGTGASPIITAPPCRAPSPSGHALIGAAQALRLLPVQVSMGVPASPGVMDLGTAQCVSVGVSQRVAVHVHARVPPLPAESHAALRPLLSVIAVSPVVASSAAAPQAGDYTLTFTAQTPGSTTITYLAATCNLPPGVC